MSSENGKPHITVETFVKEQLDRRLELKRKIREIETGLRELSKKYGLDICFE